MKHKTWFRLVLKAIGVLLVGLSLPSVINGILNGGWRPPEFEFMESIQFDEAENTLATSSSQPWSEKMLVFWKWGKQAAPSLAQMLLGLYLFFGGDWIVNKAIPSNRPYCAECGYPLAQSTGDKCPECGTPRVRA